jgi:hypothetical protein
MARPRSGRCIPAHRRATFVLWINGLKMEGLSQENTNRTRTKRELHVAPRIMPQFRPSVLTGEWLQTQKLPDAQASQNFGD